MAIKSDKWIEKMVSEYKMIDPFVENQVARNVISYGLSSYGYDIRLADEFKLFTLHFSGTVKDSDVVIDPKNPPEEQFKNLKSKECIIPPNSFVLARSLEYFRIPRNILTLCVGKSTYARCGVIVNVTPFEPEWEGYATIEISNTSPVQVKIYANEGIAQIIFFESDEICEVSYKDKKGKYQSQKKITFAKVSKGEIT